MKTNYFAEKLAEPNMLVNVPRLITAYYKSLPDPSIAEQHVSFGTSGHRGSQQGLRERRIFTKYMRKVFWVKST